MVNLLTCSDEEFISLLVCWELVDRSKCIACFLYDQAMPGAFVCANCWRIIAESENTRSVNSCVMSRIERLGVFQSEPTRTSPGYRM